MNTTIYGDKSRTRRDRGSVGRSPEYASVRDKEKRPLPGRSSSSERILVVDDEPNVALFLQVALECLPGCEVEVATSGEEALRLSKQQPFDLLITDYRMPGMNGVELTAAVWELGHQTVILIITAFADEELYRATVMNGVHQVVHKPVKRDEIRALASQALGRQGNC
ncbi:MAG: response regulator [Anaerolineae bacterium]|nr:response regulator [Anaerolineae bacterium]